MTWNIRITNEAKKDYEKIEGSIRNQVLAVFLCFKHRTAAIFIHNIQHLH